MACSRQRQCVPRRIHLRHDPVRRAAEGNAGTCRAQREAEAVIVNSDWASFAGQQRAHKSGVGGATSLFSNVTRIAHQRPQRNPTELQQPKSEEASGTSP